VVRQAKCPALGTNRRSLFQLLISPSQASSRVAECDKAGRLCRASAAFLIRAGEDNAGSIPGSRETAIKPPTLIEVWVRNALLSDTGVYFLSVPFLKWLGYEFSPPLKQMSSYCLS